MKVGDLVYAQSPLIIGTDKPGIIVDKVPMYKVGYRYKVMFPVIGLRWIKWAHNMYKLEDKYNEWGLNEAR